MSDDHMPDEERCPLCPSSGPILRVPNADKAGKPSTGEHALVKEPVDPDSVPDLVWIACTKCQTWYHSSCLLLDSGSRATIPQPVREELEKNTKDEWPFEDWTIWINRW
jgi:F-box/leucine-rich repeat protein 10/11